nr:putative polyprotein [Phytophthora infestans RNA virus 2]
MTEINKFIRFNDNLTRAIKELSAITITSPAGKVLTTAEIDIVQIWLLNTHLKLHTTLCHSEICSPSGAPPCAHEDDCVCLSRMFTSYWSICQKTQMAGNARRSLPKQPHKKANRGMATDEDKRLAPPKAERGTDRKRRRALKQLEQSEANRVMEKLISTGDDSYTITVKVTKGQLCVHSHTEPGLAICPDVRGCTNKCKPMLKTASWLGMVMKEGGIVVTLTGMGRTCAQAQNVFAIGILVHVLTFGTVGHSCQAMLGASLTQVETFNPISCAIPKTDSTEKIVASLTGTTKAVILGTMLDICVPDDDYVESIKSISRHWLGLLLCDTNPGATTREIDYLLSGAYALVGIRYHTMSTTSNEAWFAQNDFGNVVQTDNFFSAFCDVISQVVSQSDHASTRFIRLRYEQLIRLEVLVQKNPILVANALRNNNCISQVRGTATPDMSTVIDKQLKRVQDTRQILAQLSLATDCGDLVLHQFDEHDVQQLTVRDTSDVDWYKSAGAETYYLNPAQQSLVTSLMTSMGLPDMWVMSRSPGFSVRREFTMGTMTVGYAVGYVQFSRMTLTNTMIEHELLCQLATQFRRAAFRLEGEPIMVNARAEKEKEWFELDSKWSHMIDTVDGYGGSHSNNVQFGGADENVAAAATYDNDAAFVFSRVYPKISPLFRSWAASLVRSLTFHIMSYIAGGAISVAEYIKVVKYVINDDVDIPIVRWSISWMHANMNMFCCSKREGGKNYVVIGTFHRPSYHSVLMAGCSLLGVKYTPVAEGGIEIAASMALFTLLPMMEVNILSRPGPYDMSNDNINAFLCSICGPLQALGLLEMMTPVAAIMQMDKVMPDQRTPEEFTRLIANTGSTDRIRTLNALLRTQSHSMILKVAYMLASRYAQCTDIAIMLEQRVIFAPYVRITGIDEIASMLLSTLERVGTMMITTPLTPLMSYACSIDDTLVARIWERTTMSIQIIYDREPEDTVITTGDIFAVGSDLIIENHRDAFKYRAQTDPALRLSYIGHHFCSYRNKGVFKRAEGTALASKELANRLTRLPTDKFRPSDLAIRSFNRVIKTLKRRGAILNLTVGEQEQTEPRVGQMSPRSSTIKRHNDHSGFTVEQLGRVITEVHGQTSNTAAGTQGGCPIPTEEPNADNGVGKQALDMSHVGEIKPNHGSTAQPADRRHGEDTNAPLLENQDHTLTDGPISDERISTGWLSSVWEGLKRAISKPLRYIKDKFNRITESNRNRKRRKHTKRDGAMDWCCDALRILYIKWIKKEPSSTAKNSEDNSTPTTLVDKMAVAFFASIAALSTSLVLARTVLLNRTPERTDSMLRRVLADNPEMTRRLLTIITDWNLDNALAKELVGIMKKQGSSWPYKLISAVQTMSTISFWVTSIVTAVAGMLMVMPNMSGSLKKRCTKTNLNRLWFRGDPTSQDGADEMDDEEDSGVQTSLLPPNRIIAAFQRGSRDLATKLSHASTKIRDVVVKFVTSVASLYWQFTGTQTNCVLLFLSSASLCMAWRLSANLFVPVTLASAKAIVMGTFRYKMLRPILGTPRAVLYVSQLMAKEDHTRFLKHLARSERLKYALTSALRTWAVTSAPVVLVNLVIAGIRTVSNKIRDGVACLVASIRRASHTFHHTYNNGDSATLPTSLGAVLVVASTMVVSSLVGAAAIISRVLTMAKTSRMNDPLVQYFVQLAVAHPKKYRSLISYIYHYEWSRKRIVPFIGLVARYEMTSSSILYQVTTTMVGASIVFGLVHVLYLTMRKAIEIVRNIATDESTPQKDTSGPVGRQCSISFGAAAMWAALATKCVSNTVINANMASPNSKMGTLVKWAFGERGTRTNMVACAILYPEMYNAIYCPTNTLTGAINALWGLDGLIKAVVVSSCIAVGAIVVKKLIVDPTCRGIAKGATSVISKWKEIVCIRLESVEKRLNEMDREHTSMKSAMTIAACAVAVAALYLVTRVFMVGRYTSTDKLVVKMLVAALKASGSDDQAGSILHAIISQQEKRERTSTLARVFWATITTMKWGVGITTITFLGVVGSQLSMVAVNGGFEAIARSAANRLRQITGDNSISRFITKHIVNEMADDVRVAVKRKFSVKRIVVATIVTNTPGTIALYMYSHHVGMAFAATQLVVNMVVMVIVVTVVVIYTGDFQVRRMFQKAEDELREIGGDGVNRSGGCTFHLMAPTPTSPTPPSDNVGNTEIGEAPASIPLLVGSHSVVIEDHTADSTTPDIKPPSRTLRPLMGCESDGPCKGKGTMGTTTISGAAPGRVPSGTPDTPETSTHHIGDGVEGVDDEQLEPPRQPPATQELSDSMELSMPSRDSMERMEKDIHDIEKSEGAQKRQRSGSMSLHFKDHSNTLKRVGKQLVDKLKTKHTKHNGNTHTAGHGQHTVRMMTSPKDWDREGDDAWSYGKEGPDVIKPPNPEGNTQLANTKDGSIDQMIDGKPNTTDGCGNAGDASEGGTEQVDLIAHLVSIPYRMIKFVTWLANAIGCGARIITGYMIQDIPEAPLVEPRFGKCDVLHLADHSDISLLTPRNWRQYDYTVEYTDECRMGVKTTFNNDARQYITACHVVGCVDMMQHRDLHAVGAGLYMALAGEVVIGQVLRLLVPGNRYIQIRCMAVSNSTIYCTTLIPMPSGYSGAPVIDANNVMLGVLSSATPGVRTTVLAISRLPTDVDEPEMRYHITYDIPTVNLQPAMCMSLTKSFISGVCMAIGALIGVSIQYDSYVTIVQSAYEKQPMPTPRLGTLHLRGKRAKVVNVAAQPPTSIPHNAFLDMSLSQGATLINSEFTTDLAWKKLLTVQNNDANAFAYMRTYGSRGANAVPMLLTTDPIGAALYVVVNSIRMIERVIMRRIETSFYNDVYSLMQSRLRKTNTSIGLVLPIVGLLGGMLTSVYMLANSALEEGRKKAVVETQSANAKRALKDNLPYAPLSSLVAFTVGTYTHMKVLSAVMPTGPATLLSTIIGAGGAIYTLTNADAYWPYINSMCAIHVPNLLTKAIMITTSLLHMYANAAVPYMIYPVACMVGLVQVKVGDRISDLNSLEMLQSRFTREWVLKTTHEIDRKPFEIETMPFGSWMIGHELWTTNWCLAVLDNVRYAPQGSKQQTKYIPLQYTMPKKENARFFSEWYAHLMSATDRIISNAAHKGVTIRQLTTQEIFSAYNQNSTIGYYGATTGLLKTDLVTYLVKNHRSALIRRCMSPNDEVWAWEMYIKNEILAKDKTRLLVGQTVPSKVVDMGQRTQMNEVIYEGLECLRIFAGVNTIRDMAPYLVFMRAVFKIIIEADWSRYDGRQSVRRMIAQEMVSMRLMLHIGDAKMRLSAIADSLGRMERTSVKQVTLKGDGHAKLLGAQASGDIMTTSGNSIRNYADQCYVHDVATRGLTGGDQDDYITVSGDDSLYCTDNEPNSELILERSKHIGQVLKPENLIVHRDEEMPMYLSHTARKMWLTINGERKRVVMLTRSEDIVMWRFARSIEPYGYGKRYKSVMAQKCVSFMWSYIGMIEFVPAILACQIALDMDKEIETKFSAVEGYWLMKQMKGWLSITTDVQDILDAQFTIDGCVLDYGDLEVVGPVYGNLMECADNVVNVILSKTIANEDWEKVEILKDLRRMGREISSERKMSIPRVKDIQTKIGKLVVADIDQVETKIRHGKVYSTEEWYNSERTNKDQKEKKEAGRPKEECVIICKTDKQSFYHTAQCIQEGKNVGACCETEGILNPKYKNKQLLKH